MGFANSGTEWIDYADPALTVRRAFATHRPLQGSHIGPTYAVNVQQHLQRAMIVKILETGR